MIKGVGATDWHNLATPLATGNGNQDIDDKKPQEMPNKILVTLLTHSNSIFVL